MSANVYFERAIFLSWYCSKSDCKFCYMSTQKSKIKNPKLAKRTQESILAEVILCKMFDWKIEFLSGGYESYNFEELVKLVSSVCNVYESKVWLNIGTLSMSELTELEPYVEGICGAVECINSKIRDSLCPSKPMQDILQTFEYCDRLFLKKGITIILGLGETITDYTFLYQFIKDNNLDQITFYRLKPQKGTAFEYIVPIDTDYYKSWISKTRQDFPSLKIIVGSWLSHLNEFPDLIKAGANSITKFPSVGKFNSEYAHHLVTDFSQKKIKLESILAGKPILSGEKILSRLDLDNSLKDRVKQKLSSYLKKMNQ